MDKVDQTIGVLCDWIQRELGDDRYADHPQTAEMIKALAELVSARAQDKAIGFDCFVPEDSDGNLYKSSDKSKNCD